MRFRAVAILFLAVALLLAGCQSKKLEGNTQPEQPPSAQENVGQGDVGGGQSIDGDFNITQDLQEIEQLLQELDNLDNVQLDV